MITNNKNDYFVRIPVESNGTWSTKNTTTPREILNDFLIPGRVELRIAVLTLGRDISLSQINQKIFVVSKSHLTFGK